MLWERLQPKETHRYTGSILGLGYVLLDFAFKNEETGHSESLSIPAILGRADTDNAFLKKKKNLLKIALKNLSIMWYSDYPHTGSVTSLEKGR